MITILLGVLAVVAAIALPAFLFQLACVFVDVAVPGFLKAWATLLVGGLASALAATAWGCTGGLVLGSVSHGLATLAQLAIGVIVAGWAYQHMLRIKLNQAIFLALAYDLVAGTLGVAAWAALRWLWR